MSREKAQDHKPFFPFPSRSPVCLCLIAFLTVAVLHSLMTYCLQFLTSLCKAIQSSVCPHPSPTVILNRFGNPDFSLFCCSSLLTIHVATVSEVFFIAFAELQDTHTLFSSLLLSHFFLDSFVPSFCLYFVMSSNLKALNDN